MHSSHRLLAPSVAALTFLALALAAPVVRAQNPQVADKLTFKGKTAEAQWAQEDTNGCFLTTLQVSVSEQVTRETAQGTTTGTTVAVLLQIYDQCNFVDVVAAQGFGSPATFNIDQNLNTASLKATVPMQDGLNGTFFNLNVDLNWQATGAVQSDRQRLKTFGNGVRVIAKFKGDTRDASAVGTVSDGVTNFAPGIAGEASLFTTLSSTLTITKP